MKKSLLPPMTKDLLLHVDMSPGESLPLRILHAYRENCRSKWKTEGLSKDEARFYDMLNEDQDKRAEILTKAIDLLVKER
jgi:hypothetical protein